MFSRSRVVLLVLAGTASLALNVGPAQAVITEPIPDDAPEGPPLSWLGSGGASYDVLRDGTRIATVAGASYSDSFDRRSSGTYRYQVCAASSQICSSQAAVNF